jgi:hypothetical protein
MKKRKRENSLYIFINNDDIMILIYDFLSYNIKDVLNFSMISKKNRKIFISYSPYAIIINMNYNLNRFKYYPNKISNSLNTLVKNNTDLKILITFQERILKEWNYPVLEYKEEFKLLFLNMEFTKYEKNSFDNISETINFHFKDDKTNLLSIDNSNSETNFFLYEYNDIGRYFSIEEEIKVRKDFIDLNNKLTKNIHFKYLIIFFVYLMKYFYENILEERFLINYEMILNREFKIFLEKIN